MGPLSLSIVPFEAPVVNLKLRFNDSNTTELLLRSTLALFVRLNPFFGDLPVKIKMLNVQRKKVELINSRTECGKRCQNIFLLG